MRSIEKEQFFCFLFSVDVWPLTILFIVLFACGDAVVGEDSSSLRLFPFSVYC